MKRAVLVLSWMLVLLLPGCADEDRTASTASEPSPEAASYLRGAMRMAQRDQLEEAMAAVLRAKELSPEAADVYLVEGQILFAGRDFEGASDAFERAIELSPGDAKAWEMRGHTSFQRRQYQAAISHYRRAASLDETPFVWQGIGSAYRELYQPDSAFSAYQHVTEIDSTFAPAWASMAEIREDEGAFEEALRYAERASIAAPRAPAFQYLRARLLVEVGRAAEAVPVLEEIAHRNPEDFSALYTLGRAYMRIGESALAESTLVIADDLRRSASEQKKL